jgi:hypothetical protein
MEHVTHPIETLRGISKVLKHGGVAILSMPNADGWGAKAFGRRWLHWHIPYHLQFFSKKSMELAAEQTGFALEQVKTITSSDWLYLQWNHLLMYPKMGESSVFWSPQSKKKGIHKSIIFIMELVHMTRFNHIITRLFDALGLGDNYVLFFRKI